MSELNIKHISLFSFLAVALMLSGGMIGIMAMDSSAADGVDNDQGEKTFYTYTFNFQFDGSDAESIVWDFGFNKADGTRATSTEWNPTGIVFPAKGEYIITQTVSNPLGSYTSRLILNVLGTPEVTFETNGGNEIGMKMIKAGSHLSAPTPVKNGYVFEGWYKDSGFTELWNESVDTVNEHMTLYAKWSERTIVDPPTDPEPTDPTPTDPIGDDDKEKKDDSSEDNRIIIDGDDPREKYGIFWIVTLLISVACAAMYVKDDGKRGYFYGFVFFAVLTGVLYLWKTGVMTICF